MRKFTVYAVLTVCAGWIFGLFALGIITPDGEVSVPERRKLAQMPEINADSLLSGEFMSGFETYSADQFPFRESFRRIKALGQYRLFMQSDSNGIYLHDGYAAKLDFPLDEGSVDHAAERMRFIYESFLEGKASAVYLSVIPDKNYFMRDGGAPTLDYDEMVRQLTEKADFAEYIDIFPYLELSDYYRTDTHWRIEKIGEAAKALAEGMGVSLSGQWEAKPLDVRFYGVLCGQSALPLGAEEMYIISSPEIDGARVYNAETGEYQGVYDLGRAGGADPYEVYLGGARSLMSIENPAAKTDKELIIFRDSFGSSLAPHLIEAYRKITLVDTRYLAAPMLGRFLDADGADVLMIYSTMILNSSETMT